jgi:uncharacterized membrane protein YccC
VDPVAVDEDVHGSYAKESNRPRKSFLSAALRAMAGWHDGFGVRDLGRSGRYFLYRALELSSAASAGTGLLILVGPTQGMLLSKAIYRIAGTLFGTVFAIILTSLFSQDRTMLIAVFSVYMACLVAIATLLRDFRAYGCILAGYTVALISIADVDAPTATFTAMLDRVAVILLAVLVLAFVSAIFATAESARSLQSKLRLATKDIVEMALAQHDLPNGSLGYDRSDGEIFD